MNEMIRYLSFNQGMEEETATELAEEIFNNRDRNGDELLNIEEFADEYIEIIKKLRSRLMENEDRMLENYEQYKHYKKMNEKITYEQEKNFQKKCELRIHELDQLPRSDSQVFVTLTLLIGVNQGEAQST